MSKIHFLLLLVLICSSALAAYTPLDVVKLSNASNVSCVSISGLNASAAQAIARLNPAIGEGHYSDGWLITPFDAEGRSYAALSWQAKRVVQPGNVLNGSLPNNVRRLG